MYVDVDGERANRCCELRRLTVDLDDCLSHDVSILEVQHFGDESIEFSSREVHRMFKDFCNNRSFGLNLAMVKTMS